MLQIQGPQKLRSEEPLYARGNEEVAAQRRRWTFCVTIKYSSMLSSKYGSGNGFDLTLMIHPDSTIMKKGTRFLNLKLGKRITDRPRPWTIRPLKKTLKKAASGQ